MAAGPEEVCCTRGRFSVHRTARPRGSSEIHSSPSDCRPEEACCVGVLSLAVSRRGQPERRSMRGERCSERDSLGTLSCYPGEARRDGQGEGMITPLGNGVRQLLVIMPSTAPFRKRKHSVDTESAQHARTLCHTPLHRHCAQ